MSIEQYNSLNFKIPKESEDYMECSDFVVLSIEKIMRDAMDTGKNKIIINTNLKLGMPMENINKIAGPFIEAWAYEKFVEVFEDDNNAYQLINVESCERLDMADVILQFKKKRKRQSSVTANVDVKATSNDIENSGKSPNITSFIRIRTAYLKDPDYIFIILSIKHKVYSQRASELKMMMGIMEVVDFNAYDLKYISETDISYNPALGSGQLQVRDIHYVTRQNRNVWEFCQMLDKKCIASQKGFEVWYGYAKKFIWIKDA
ncbi:type II restriction enzyme [Candidatus Magnetoovum chiemensis]|nr:type II restriction enzyme [Candidatus Magnetoovum chiemensis]